MSFRPRPRRAAVVAGAVLLSLGSIGALAPTASADSGGAHAVRRDDGNYRATTYYQDDGDKVTVCDVNGADHHGAVGWIQVRQADGHTYKKFPSVYDGRGSGSCVSVVQDVIRESSVVGIFSCYQDGPSGEPWGCGATFVNG